MSDIKKQLLEDIKQAMRDKNKDLLTILRGLSAAIKQAEVDGQIEEVTDEQVVTIIMQMTKQRKESAQQYREADRVDLAEKEEQEIAAYQTYLPEQLSADEINQMIDEAISSTGASSVKDMSQIMGLLKPKLLGKADISEVGAMIRQRLNG